MSNKKKSFIFHGGLLAATSIIVRLIGFFYRVPLVRILGETGVGYYSSAFEVYAYLLIISSYGMPSAISKLISARLAKKEYDAARDVFKGALLLSITVGGILSIFLYTQADFLAKFFGNEGATIALRALTPALFIFSVLAVFRGYFQGYNTMVPTSISQLLEQVFNAVFSLVLVFYLLPKGLEYGASGGTLGTGVGALVALIFMIFIFLKYDQLVLRKHRNSNKKFQLLDTWKIIFLTAFPMILGSSIYNLSNLTDMAIFQRGLVFQGLSKEQVSYFYGIMGSKYKLIITVPIAMASAFGAASIPSITKSLTLGNTKEVKEKIKYAFKIIFIICLPSIVGLMTLGNPILYLLFGGSSLELTSKILFAGAPVILFFSLSTILIALLQGVDKIMVPVKNSAIAISVKIIMLLIFNFLLKQTIVGSIITNYVFSILIVTLNLISLKKVVEIDFDFKNIVLYPLLASLGMGAVVMAVYSLLGFITNSNTVSVLFAIVLGALSYFVIVIKLKVFSESELSSLGAIGRIGKRLM